METVTYSEADEKYDIEQYVEAPFFDDAEVHVYAEDADFDGDLDISELGNCLFLKDVRIAGNIINSSDGEGPLFLIVLGNCTAKNVLLDEPLVCIQGNLNVANIILADYNHGVLRVRGNLNANVLFAEHEVWVSGKVEGLAIDLGGLHVRDENFKPGSLSDLVPEVLGEDGSLDTKALRDRVESGAPVRR